MDALKPADYQMRFRHLDGDVGPFPFQQASSVADMKTRCWESWPTEGAIKDQVRPPGPPATALARGRPHASPGAPWVQHASPGHVRGSMAGTNAPRRAQKPATAALLRIFYQGKLLEDGKTIRDLERLPGEMVPGKMLTLHLHIQQPAVGKASGAKDSNGGSGRPGCCSVM